LAQARENFAAFGAAAREYQSQVRKPLPEEVPLPFELADTSWSLLLHAYPDEAPPASVYAEFFERMTKLLEELGAPPTYIGASGPGYPGKYVEYGGRVTKRLLDTSFADVHSVELATTPPGSDAPAGDSFVVASLWWWESDFPHGEPCLELNLTMNEAVLPLRSQRCDELLRELLVWRQWSYGFAEISHRDEELSEEEEEAQMVWTSTEAAQRRRTTWRALPVLALSEEQLAQPMGGKESFLGRLAGRRRIRTLADFIGAAEGTRSEKIGGLLLWWIPQERLADIRDRLSGTPAVLPERRPDDYWEAPEPTSEATAEPLPEPSEPNPARDALWELIRTQLAAAPELLPVVSFEAFFEGNDEEDSIAPNQVGSGRPPLAEMYATLKQIAARADVQAVLVSIHDDSLYYLERGDTYGEPYGWPAAEHVILITTAAREEVERWVEDFGADSVDDGWPAAKHPAAPVPAPGHRVYTVVWD
jgi:hypothetical protein